MPVLAAEHEVVQGIHGVLAALAGGVEVAADVEPVLGDIVAGQAAGDLLLGLQWPRRRPREGRQNVLRQIVNVKGE
jgi:hypothetical protein